MTGELEVKVYEPGVVPLAEALTWPDDMVDREAEFFVGLVEATGNRLLGATPCNGPVDHESWFTTEGTKGRPCPGCGAAL